VTRALFVTVASNELYMPVAAWRNSMGPSGHITFNAGGPSNDETILACARGYAPEVIFYIGANVGAGLPTTRTLRDLRGIAPSVHYQSDVEDEAWFDLLEQYRDEDCFDLIVGQTGVETSLTDMASLMAIDIEAFRGPAAKTLFCGFSGSCCDLSDYKPGVSAWDGRAEILQGLRNYVGFRPREPGDYQSYVEFMKRCMIAINVSFTGSGKRHHVKWRVLEAAFADCALLEMEDSPTAQWFPEGSYLTYGNINDARRILQRMRIPEIDRVAARLSAYARQHYTPGQIYGNILAALADKGIQLTHQPRGACNAKT
jgi:hypothetical protein